MSLHVDGGICNVNPEFRGSGRPLPPAPGCARLLGPDLGQRDSARLRRGRGHLPRAASRSQVGARGALVPTALRSPPRHLPRGRAALGGQEEESDALAGSLREPKPRHHDSGPRGRKREDELHVRPHGGVKGRRANWEPGGSRPRPGPACGAGPSAPVMAPGTRPASGTAGSARPK